MLDDFAAYLSKWNKASIIVVGILFIGTVGTLDLITGYELAFSIFYLAPISLVAWFAGGRAGLITAIISALVWLAADVFAGHDTSHPAIPLWNAGVRFAFFAVVVLALSRLKLSYERQKNLIRELREATDEVKVLSGLIPICAWCKKIRDDKGYWQQVETYITEHSEASFTHAICPECKKKWDEELRAIKQTGP